MGTNYIYKYARKISIVNLIIPSVLSILLFILVTIVPLTDVLSPVYITSPSSAEQFYSKGKLMVDIYLKDLYYTGYNSTVNKKVNGYYYYCIENGKCTFILIDAASIDKPSAKLNSYSTKAVLRSNNKQLTKMISKFSNDLSWTKDGMLNVSSFCYIDETAYNTSLYLYLLLCSFVITVLILSYLVINIFYIIAPSQCPACVSFNKISNASDSIELVNEELDNPIIDLDKIQITENYFVYHSNFSLVILPISSISKMYKHVSHTNVHSLKKLTHRKKRRRKVTKQYNLYVETKYKHTYHLHDIKPEYLTVLSNYIEHSYPEITIFKMHDKI